MRQPKSQATSIRNDSGEYYLSICLSLWLSASLSVHQFGRPTTIGQFCWLSIVQFEMDKLFVNTNDGNGFKLLK